ncbi:hypothetical protein BLNAU_6750 [Blattamonas nauphoetae]|uniref:DDE-1 domain-containing protein n=1 Tax=Blattamonas nauphoetae TaxID=2049346 RepID=A0ABQ9WTX8_9EUKA|nr:hypothetical protein BLNAU_22127 [Blattamonas nauphoetae]KAK2958263.1 hypothetical protein BLNAU_6750 [Blattamonas nauphoetae]
MGSFQIKMENGPVLTLSELHAYISVDQKDIHPRSPHVVLLDGAVVRMSQFKLPFLEGLLRPTRIRHLTAFLQGEEIGRTGTREYLNKAESTQLQKEILELISNGIHPTYKDVGRMAFSIRRDRLRYVSVDIHEPCRSWVSGWIKNHPLFKALKPIFYNFDETSLVSTQFIYEKRITTYSSSVAYSTPPSMIFSHTMLFTIAADGEALTSHLILPAKTNQDSLSRHFPSRFSFHTSQKGWMNKELLYDILINGLGPEIQERKRKIKKPLSRALLIFDGHSSRNQPTLWKQLADLGIDSICLPSNCSSIMQPCDLYVNSAFKRNLQKLPPLPSKTKQNSELIPWLLKVESAALTALDNSEQIIASFRESGIFPFNPEIVTSQLRDGSPAEETRRGFPLGSKVLSDPVVQSGWRTHLKLPDVDDEQDLETVNPLSIQAEIDDTDPFLEAHQLALRKRLMFPSQSENDDEFENLPIYGSETPLKQIPTGNETTTHSSSQPSSNLESHLLPQSRGHPRMIRDDDDDEPIPRLPTKTKRQNSTPSTIQSPERQTTKQERQETPPSLHTSTPRRSSTTQGGRTKHTPEWFRQFG